MGECNLKKEDMSAFAIYQTPLRLEACSGLVSEDTVN